MGRTRWTPPERRRPDVRRKEGHASRPKDKPACVGVESVAFSQPSMDGPRNPRAPKSVQASAEGRAQDAIGTGRRAKARRAGPGHKPRPSPATSDALKVHAVGRRKRKTEGHERKQTPRGAPGRSPRVRVKTSAIGPSYPRPAHSPRHAFSGRPSCPARPGGRTWSICPDGQSSQMANLPKWPICPDGQSAQVANLPRWPIRPDDQSAQVANLPDG